MTLPTKSNAILEWLDDNELGNRPIVIVYRKIEEDDNTAYRHGQLH